MGKWGSIIFMYVLATATANAAEKKNWREFLMSELTPAKYPLLFEDQISRGAPADLIKYCPNYPNLKDEEKKIILMRLLDGMVFFESSCNSNASAKGPYGTAYGVLQLHLGREHDYARGCKKLDSKNPKRSLACSVSMLHNQVENSKRLFSSGSYWDVLRPRGVARKAYTIASHIWYYPLCQPK